MAAPVVQISSSSGRRRWCVRLIVLLLLVIVASLVIRNHLLNAGVAAVETGVVRVRDELRSYVRDLEHTEDGLKSELAVNSTSVDRDVFSRLLDSLS
jgi:hypothetical protein